MGYPIEWARTCGAERIRQMVKEKETPGAYLKKLLKTHHKNKWEAMLLYQIKVAGLPTPQTQYKFHPDRKYKADFCWPEILLVAEVDGGVWLPKGGHTSGKGYTADRIRDCEALLLGFKMMRVTPAMVKNGMAIDYLGRLFYGTEDWQKKKKTTL